MTLPDKLKFSPASLPFPKIPLSFFLLCNLYLSAIRKNILERNMNSISPLAQHSPLLFRPTPKFHRHFLLSRYHFTCAYASPVSLFTTPLLRRRKRTGGLAGCFVPDHCDESITSSLDATKISLVPSFEEGEAEAAEIVLEEKRQDFPEKESILSQIIEIGKFSGPAVGLWLCGPLMSLIDTAVVGQGSSIELAALGPGTVFCDYASYAFMFLSIATSNLVATSLAKGDKDEVQHQISILLFIGLSCGVLMLAFTVLFGPWALKVFAGAKNTEIIAAANTYVQIRGLAWPAVLIGWVAQSASLGMKDSWGPLKALAVASIINGAGDIFLCRYLNYGIAGAAWATMVSQVVAGYMMIKALDTKGFNGFAISVPSFSESLEIFMLAAPVFLTMTSKVAFYCLLVYFATSMGTQTVAAHQVMVQLYGICSVWGEPLSQTAQSFMPELIYGANRSLPKARTLLKSLVIIAALSGTILGSIGVSVPLLFPQIFSPDPDVIKEMHKVLIPYFLALSVTPSNHCLEGTLLAGRDLKFISSSMTGIFFLGSILLLLLSRSGFGLTGCWFALVAFQWSRFCIALWRLTSRDGVLYSEDTSRFQVA